MRAKGLKKSKSTINCNSQYGMSKVYISNNEHEHEHPINYGLKFGRNVSVVRTYSVHSAMSSAKKCLCVVTLNFRGVVFWQERIKVNVVHNRAKKILNGIVGFTFHEKGQTERFIEISQRICLERSTNCYH